MSDVAKPEANKSPVETSTALLPLTPRYDESQHSVYVIAVVEALEASRTLRWRQVIGHVKRVAERIKLDRAHWQRSWRIRTPGEGIRNIALTGGYGVGKSSILQEVARQYRRKVVQVSLSTLSSDGAPLVPAKADAAQSGPAQGLVGSPQINPASGTKTNQIQKEIVKQLLYRESPVRMPGSRFKRIGRFQLRRAVAIGFLGGLIATVVFYLAGWTTKLAGVELLGKLDSWLHVVVFGVALLVTVAILGLFHNRIQIRQVKVAEADIALSSDAVNYFDQYLDEIVYFFEVTKRDVVIFEDIDRFDDPHIFETLRALNTLLNGAGQLSRRHIRFIYAIKDSIFAQLGDRPDDTGDPAQAPPQDAEAKKRSDRVAAEGERANRTKFFDLVIPVVPFITHRNARNLMDEVLRDVNGNIDPRLIDLAARHITDMRLIKNVRNEFVVFKRKVIKADDGGELRLSDNALFAMMLYKSTHLDDFELIKAGSSKLDDLDRAYRAIVAHRQGQFSIQARQLRRQLTDLSTADQRSQELAEDLKRYVQQVGRIRSVSATAQLSYLLAGDDRTEELTTPAFWKDLSAGAPLQVNFRERTGAIREQLQFAKDDAVAVLGASVASEEAWDEANRDDINTRLNTISATVDELAHSDWGYFYDHSELADGDGNNLAEHAKILDSPLAQELVAGGFLGRDFTLYTSTYYSGRVSTNAWNFLMHNVDRNVVEPRFALSAEEVDSIVVERGDPVLREHGMYNVNVFDRLLAGRLSEESDDGWHERSRRAAVLIAGFASNDVDGQRFLNIYFADGTEKATLLRRLAPRWAEVFEFITTRTDLEADLRAMLFDAALAGATGRIAYELKDNGVKEFVEANLSQLSVLTAVTTDVGDAQRLALLLQRAAVRVEDLDALGEPVRRAVIDTTGFTVCRANLEMAIGGTDLSLDNIRARAPKVYEYVLANLDSYLDDLRTGNEAAVTITSSEAAPAVLASLAERPGPTLARVVDMAEAGLQVRQLADVPQSVWSTLATRKRFPATFANVASYINAIGAIDADLASVLSSAGTISGAKELADADKLGLCEMLLDASGVLPEPEVRVRLVDGLGLKDWLPPSMVPAEHGRLIGLLVEAEVVADDEATFEMASKQDWKTREFLINQSPNFAAYMTPTEVPVADVAPLMASTLVPLSVKDAVLARADDFVPTDHRAAMTALATQALARKAPAKLPVALVSRMATAGVPASQLVQLLVPILEEMPEAQLSSILTTMGGEYAKVATRNGNRRKLPKTKPDLALANRLKRLDMASTVVSSEKNIAVNMKKG